MRSCARHPLALVAPLHMLIKSTSRRQRSAYRQLIEYNLRVRSQDCAPELIFLQNLRSKTPQGWIDEYVRNDERRITTRKDSVRAFHEVMSFAAEDSQYLNKKVLKDMVEEYIARRAPEALVIAVLHSDKAHLHVHLVISGTTYGTGRSTSVSKAKFGNIKKEIEELQRQRYPELLYSFAQGKDRYRGRAKDSVPTRQTRKAFLYSALSDVMEQTTTTAGLQKRLEDMGIAIYFRRGIPTGLRYLGKKYRFKKLGIDIEKFLKRTLDRNR